MSGFIKRPNPTFEMPLSKKARSDTTAIAKSAAPNADKQLSPSLQSPETQTLPSFAELTRGLPDHSTYAVAIAPLRGLDPAPRFRLHAPITQGAMAPPKPHQKHLGDVSVAEGAADRQTPPGFTAFEVGGERATHFIPAGIAPARLLDKSGRPIAEATLKTLAALGFEAMHVQRICKRYGAIGTLQALVESTPRLRARGFAILDLVKIASNNGAAQALSALLAHGPKLMDAGFSQTDLTKIASNDGATGVLRALAQHHRALMGSGFSHATIVAIAASRSASEKLALLVTHQALLQRQGHTEAIILQKAKDTAGQFRAWVNNAISQSEF